MKVVTRAQADLVTDLWHLADDHQRAQLSLSESPRADAVLARDGAFAVGLFDDEDLVSVAAAFPARGDDGRSTHNVPGLAHISSVATRPDRWSEGLARRTLAALLSQARRRGFARVQLFTYAANVPALRLYATEGFVSSGRVRATPDGERLAHLLSEIPALEPFNRSAARVLCRDGQDRLLLMHWRDPVDGHQVWEPPGGGIEAGEDPLTAVHREWLEETGLEGLEVEPAQTQVSRDTFWAGARLVADEWFFAGHIDRTNVRPGGFTESEREQFVGYGWFSLAEIADLDDEVVPDLIPVLHRLAE